MVQHRRIALSGFAGDAWAQPNAQVAVPSGVGRIRITSSPLAYRITGYTGVDPGSTPVDGSAALVSVTVVKINTDSEGNTVLARTVPLTDVAVGGYQLTEDDVSPGDIVTIGIEAATANGTPAIWIDVDNGGRVLP